MEKVRTLFIGTSEFAVPALEALASRDFIELVGVVTQPDKPVGRDQKITSPVIKESARRLKVEVPVFQPEKIKESAEEILEKTKPDLIIVASYGQILPASIINYPKYKCLNIHGSILPELRGAVPIQMAILKGFDETGVSIIVMTEKMDDGQIVSTSKIKIRKEETTKSLAEQLSKIGAKSLIKILPDWIAGKVTAKPQDDNLATYCYMKDISKENAEIDFGKPVEQIERMIRAFYPWPVAWVWVESGGQKKRLKIYKAALVDINSNTDLMGHLYDFISKIPEKDKKEYVLTSFDKRLFIANKRGALELIQVQLEGKKVGTGGNYLHLAQKV